MKWGRIVVAGLGTHAAVFLVITLAVSGYAFKLAFAAHGAPDQARIGQYAGYLGRSFWWVLQIALTAPAAAWTVRKTQSAHQLHGALTGLVVALVGLAIGYSMSVRAIAVFALTVGAGWLGAAMRERYRMKQESGHPPTR